MANPATVARVILDYCDGLIIGAPPLPLAMPDVAFTPPADGKYLRVDLFTNAPFWQGLTSGRLDQGLLQIVIVWPEGEGIIKHREIVAEVYAAFPKGLTLHGAATRVKFNREPWAASAIQGGVSTDTPITISWTAS